MLKKLHIAMLLAAALLFGTAQAACACAPYEAMADAAALHQTDGHGGHGVHGAKTGADHDGAMKPGGAHDCAGDGAPCGDHGAAADAGDILAAASLQAPVKVFAAVILPAASSLNAPRSQSRAGVSWTVRPPPVLSPVSLKTRLRL